VLYLLGTANITAQTAPPPAPAQENPIILLGGTAHLGNGETIENCAIAFENGKILSISTIDDLNLDLGRFETIPIEGKHVYPGLISPVSGLGLSEIGSVRSTVDSREIGDLNPNVRSIIAYNTDSEVIPTIRSNGILLAQITPGGGIISGTSSIVQLDAWNWEDAAIKLDDGIHLNWPSMLRRRGYGSSSTSSANPNYPIQVAKLEQLFTDARSYSLNLNPEKANLRLEAMKGLFDGRTKLFISAGYVKEIIESIQFAKKHKIQNIVLVGGDEDAWLVKDFLKENNIPVIVAHIHRMAKRKDYDVHEPFKLPYLFMKEGILTGILYPGATGSMNLPFVAGHCVGYGLTKEEALQCITLNNAKILGIEDKYGSLETGKSATIVVSSGDLLDIRTNQVEMAFISGRKIDLDNKHKLLYRKYKEKYDRNKDD
jgi:hypothetical protein